MPNKNISEESFHFGRKGERAYMAFSRRHGRVMVEVGALREKLGEGAPMIYLPQKYLGKDKMISPDFLTINTKAMLQSGVYSCIDENFIWTRENIWNYPCLWDEVKSKNGCTYSRIFQVWQTGIDAYQLRHYRMVQQTTKIPVMLSFLQLDSSTAQKDAPLNAGKCPTGLYVCPVMQKPDTTYPWKVSVEKAKMVYWNISKLMYLASLEELFAYDKVQDVPINHVEERKVKLTPKQIAIIQSLPDVQDTA